VPGVFGTKSPQLGDLFRREHGVKAADWPVQGHTREVLCQKFGSGLQGAYLTASQVEHLILRNGPFHNEDAQFFLRSLESSHTQTLCDPRCQEIAMFSRDRPRVSGRNFHPHIKENKQMHE
jgi:hypothetical protein